MLNVAFVCSLRYLTVLTHLPSAVIKVTKYLNILARFRLALLVVLLHSGRQAFFVNYPCPRFFAIQTKTLLWFSLATMSIISCKYISFWITKYVQSAYCRILTKCRQINITALTSKDISLFNWWQKDRSKKFLIFFLYFYFHKVLKQHQ